MKNLLQIRTIIICLFLGYTKFVLAQNSTIDIEQAINSTRKIYLSEIAKSIQYVILENKEEYSLQTRSPINNMQATAYVSNNKIILACHNILIFNRGNGHFLNYIGENQRACYSLPFDENNNRIMIYGKKGYNEYTLDNKLVRKIPYPTSQRNNGEFVGHIDSDKIACIDEKAGVNRNTKLYICNTEKVIKTTPKHKPYDWKGFVGGFYGGAYRYKDKLYMYDEEYDTIFHINQYGEFPKYILKKGKHAISAENRRDITIEYIQSQLSSRYNKRIGEYFTDFTFCENNLMVLFNFLYNGVAWVGYFDKQTGKCHIASKNDEQSIFMNDLDGFIPVTASKWILNKHNTMTAIIPYSEVIKWFRTNPQKIINLTPKQRALGDIKNDDSLIICIIQMRSSADEIIDKLTNCTLLLQK